MSNALMIAISAILRPVPAASGIVPIGSKSTAQTLTISTGTISGNVTCDLPSGCAAGDVITLSCFGTGYGGFSWSAPSEATVAMSQRTFASAYSIAAYVYTLTQGDVDAGTVNVPYTLTTSGSYSIPVVVTIDSYRNVDSSYLDVVGTFASGSLTNGSNTCTAPSITTTEDEDLLQYSLFYTTSSASSTVTPPDGWTSGDSPFSVNKGAVITGHLLQTTSGATGDVAASLSVGFTSSDSWGMVLLSLRYHNPTFRMLGSLAATGTVGTAYSSTLTLAGDYTGTVTIDASSGTIPSWMTPTVSGNAVTFAGTPDTAETETFTPRATDSSGTPKVAVGDEQSITVGEATATSTRYWRIYVTANNGYTSTSIAELEFRATSGGASLCTGGTPSASSEYSASYTAAKAFDGDNNTNSRWISQTGAAAAPCWLAYTLPTASKVNEIALTAAFSSNQTVPKDFKIQSSADGSSWSDEWSVSGQTGWANRETRVFTRPT